MATRLRRVVDVFVGVGVWTGVNLVIVFAVSSVGSGGNDAGSRGVGVVGRGALGGNTSGCGALAGGEVALGVERLCGERVRGDFARALLLGAGVVSLEGR